MEIQTIINYYCLEGESDYLEELLEDYLNQEEENEYKRGLILGISGVLFVIGYIDLKTYRYIIKLMGV